MIGTIAGKRLGRRDLLRMVGTAAGITAAGGLGAACGSGGAPADMSAVGPTIRIGFVSPATGALSPFGDADRFVIDAMKRHFAQNPIRIGGRGHRVEILDRDSQSNVNRAGDVASDLILNGGIHLMLVAGTADTANPVGDQCEAGKMPCIATAGPWQEWSDGRAGRPAAPLRWTYDFAWGVEDVAAVYADMWDELRTNKVAGGLWPDDPEGRTWGDPAAGLPAAQSGRGYRLLGLGSYPVHSRDFTRLIDSLRSGNSDVLVGVPTSTDFITFWKQAARRGYRPRIATIGRALMFPSGVEALGPLGANLSTDVYWSPSHPYVSSLTGQTARQLADAYTAATGRQWVQPIGPAHALFEVAATACSAVSTPDDREGLARAISGMRIDTIAGPLDWTTGPVPNVASTPLVGGQWRTGTSNPFELVVVSNTRNPDVPVDGSVQPLRTTG